ncbi:hypothetical protein N408_01055 [Helicobacter pylori FD703]|nr:hypothetical protein N408_01055 [Helicobacter pylori FD703]
MNIIFTIATVIVLCPWVMMILFWIVAYYYQMLFIIK